MVQSNSLWLHRLQHARLPWPSLSPRICSDSCLLSQWCYPTISSSAIPFSSCLQSLPAWGSFLMSQLFASGGQIIDASGSASDLLVSIQGWFPLGLIGLILQSKGPSRVFSSTAILKLLYGPTLISVHDHWKNHSFDYMDLCWQWCLCFLIHYLGVS